MKFIGKSYWSKKFQLYKKKIWFLWMWNLGQFRKNRYLVNNCLIKIRMWKIPLYMCDSYHCNYLPHTHIRLYLIGFQLKRRISLSNFAFFYRKITLALLKDRFLKKMLLIREKSVSFFFCKTIGSNNFFYCNWKLFQVFKIAKFEFKVTVHYSLWAK